MILVCLRGDRNFNGLGEVAALSRTRQSTLAFTRPASLSVAKVFAKLTEIANLSGNKASSVPYHC